MKIRQQPMKSQRFTTQKWTLNRGAQTKVEKNGLGMGLMDRKRGGVGVSAGGSLYWLFGNLDDKGAWGEFRCRSSQCGDIMNEAKKKKRGVWGVTVGMSRGWVNEVSCGGRPGMALQGGKGWRERQGLTKILRTV